MKGGYSVVRAADVSEDAIFIVFGTSKMGFVRQVAVECYPEVCHFVSYVGIPASQPKHPVSGGFSLRPYNHFFDGYAQPDVLYFANNAIR